MIYLAVPDNIQQRNNIWTSREVLQDLNLPLYLLLLHRLEDFDDAFLVIDYVDAFEDLRVLPTTCIEKWKSASGLHVLNRAGTNQSFALLHSSPVRPK